MNDDLKRLEKELGEIRVQMNLSTEDGLRVKPNPKLTPELIEQIMEHKEDLIHRILETSQESDDILRCRACFGEIRPTEPFLSLEYFIGEGEDARPSGDQRPYHTDHPCAEKLIALGASTEGDAFMVHQVHVCDEEQPGPGCSWRCFG